MKLRLIFVFAIALALGACGDSADPGSVPLGPGTTEGAPSSTVPATVPSGDLQGLTLEAVASGLENPVLVTAPRGDDRVFIIEQPGRVRIVEDGKLLAEPFLDVTDSASAGSLEQGLLGLAFHPDFAVNDRFFVYYTDDSGDTRVVSYRAGDDPNRADPGSASVLLLVDQPAGNHNGGMLAFGPDGYLYIALGDGGGANDQFGNGQRPDTLLGTLLRLDIDAATPYAIPPDNPFVAGGGRAEVWAYGLRNPWRFSFDAETSLLYIADVGQAEYEEVNVIDAGAAGVNYGWSIVEAFECFEASTCDDSGTTLPVLAYPHSEGCSIIGGYVYRGAAVPELAGHYFYGDWCGGWVQSFRHDAGDAVDRRDWSEDFGPIGRVLSFGEDGFGEMYVTTDSGAVWRIAARR